jgi:feruloyl-CoA synthase
LIFVQDGLAFASALQAVGNGIRILAVDNVWAGQDRFDELLDIPVSEAVHTAHLAVNADTVAKVLFTSGSTGLPKGVINTHGNITTNWQQITQTFPFISHEQESITLIDWLPWNHVFGGNHNFGITLYNGGTLYIDEGDPTPKGMLTTLKNIGDISPNVYFNVPKGFEELVNHLKENKALCERFFHRLKLLFYAGASMPQHVWDGLEQLAYDTLGKRLLISTGLGMTEASPSCIFNTRTGGASGELGVPVPGLEVKLVPDGDKLEARFKGGNITPGYWRDPEATAKAFDEEGFYRTGDALKLIDEHDVNKGMRFDGRIAEDFKLATGTWVNVGVLRSKLIKAANGLIQDAVITGHDRDFLGAIVFPELNYCRKLADLLNNATVSEVVRHPKVRAALQLTLNELGKKNTGSSTCIRRATLADFTLSIDRGEITDKGSINQRAILKYRADTVALLYQDDLPEAVIEFQNETYA